MEEPNEIQRREQERFFVDENLHGEPRELASPSGRYRLTIRTYRTGPNTWHYSRGTVARALDGTIVCDIKRNYGVFHHSFVTKDGHEYLITGRSYMSQTIVDLDTGKEYEPQGDHYKGSAFCWATCSLSPDGNTLAVDGCIWACPYEFRFFDFADPARGWFELPIVGIELVEDPSDKIDPQWLDARTIECHQVDRDSVPQERTRLERRGNEMVVVEHWVSDSEQARRDEDARHDAELDTWWATFHKTDPMYLQLLELIRLHELPCDSLDWRPGARRIKHYFRRASPRASADLEWDLEAKTIKVQTYDPAGNLTPEHSFDESIQGIEAAIEVIARDFGQR